MSRNWYLVDMDANFWKHNNNRLPPICKQMLCQWAKGKQAIPGISNAHTSTIHISALTLSPGSITMYDRLVATILLNGHIHETITLYYSKYVVLKIVTNACRIFIMFMLCCVMLL